VTQADTGLAWRDCRPRTPPPYELKGSDTSLDNVLDGLGSESISIAGPQSYGFGITGGRALHTYASSSRNTFKKNPGVNGTTIRSSAGNPVQNVRVQLLDPKGALIDL